MIFKVLYQELPEEAPIRERTETLYMEAKSVREVRKNLTDKNINIEFIQQLSDVHLAFEEQSDKFVTESV